jgi:HKD family nuclease
LRILRKLLRNASGFDIAVSYIQISGWDLIERLAAKMDPSKIRLLVTDQFGITHPEALRRALERGIQVRIYMGGRTYHPKMYLVYDANGLLSSAIVGSANISGSGLETGIEIGVVISDPGIFADVRNYFEQLFENEQCTIVPDDLVLEKLSQIRLKTAARKIEIQRIRREFMPKPIPTSSPSPEDVDVLDDIFSTISLPIGILSIEHAGNNIRNLNRLLQVLERYPDITNKEHSELHLLGLMEEGELTDLGWNAKTCQTEKELAEVWCGWVLNQDEYTLKSVNPRIDSFRRAASQFWRLKAEVRSFFLDNLQVPEKRKILKTIELLCNGGKVVRKLSLNDIKSLASILLNVNQLPTYLQEAVKDYQENKGWTQRSESGPPNAQKVDHLWS